MIVVVDVADAVVAAVAVVDVVVVVVAVVVVDELRAKSKSNGFKRLLHGKRMTSKTP